MGVKPVAVVTKEERSTAHTDTIAKHNDYPSGQIPLEAMCKPDGIILEPRHQC